MNDIINDLRGIKETILKNKARSYPKCIFDLEIQIDKLVNLYKENCLKLGFKGGIKENVPELYNLKEAIKKLSGMCSTGAFAVPYSGLCIVIDNVIGLLEQQIKDQASPPPEFKSS